MKQGGKSAEGKFPNSAKVGSSQPPPLTRGPEGIPNLPDHPALAVAATSP